LVKGFVVSHCNICVALQLVPHNKHTASVIESNHLMLCREIIAFS